MAYFFLFLFELLVLFFVSQKLTKSLSQFLFSLTKNQRLTINLLSILFLPGVIVHELSHFIMARILFVYTGEIEFFPSIRHQSRHSELASESHGILNQVKDDRKSVRSDTVEIKLGSVTIAKTDPVRRLLIGIAPLLVGIAILLYILSLIINNTLMIYIIKVSWFMQIGEWVLVFYVISNISCTMFSSKKDMEGSAIIVVIVILLLLFLYVAGVRVQYSFIEQLFTPRVSEFFWKSDLFLLVPLVINSIISFLLSSRAKRSNLNRF
ncbi:MAG: hypothetical protein A3F31_01305 [Candidatus Levybacteria bacterium RIFCSPHIGHO2_12_FULL_38_12]|nr:MAG: hypothetical protein A2770_02005 [Candidatus Levybacteria bacterium RIFCSPHIGHO2_01_FULL_38_12]OGH23299.1 MAG: hypothetical protein A3F31_01305 [Candidatus Levybacteria bacterium RIFCSPHIGHO2_12_FULL_38_12]OGH34442.1 MAG: hypothetical protein A3A47_00225 [Candidatus Levybacteria bacterium RIFCSPLOWO2_01_FULL_37_20]OGH44260.1 MAG: hypothetical protein A3J14_01765 [Candidatus Levybacteria bacterium RIFCSPLOWO2_02_FULL_37_18]